MADKGEDVKVSEKIDKYLDFAKEPMKVTTVFQVLGTNLKCLGKRKTRKT